MNQNELLHIRNRVSDCRQVLLSLEHQLNAALSAASPANSPPAQSPQPNPSVSPPRHSTNPPAQQQQSPPPQSGSQSAFMWNSLKIHFGQHRSQSLDAIRDTDPGYFRWLLDDYSPKRRDDGTFWQNDMNLREALDAVRTELPAGGLVGK